MIAEIWLRRLEIYQFTPHQCCEGVRETNHVEIQWSDTQVTSESLEIHEFERKVEPTQPSFFKPQTYSSKTTAESWSDSKLTAQGSFVRYKGQIVYTGGIVCHGMIKMFHKASDAVVAPYRPTPVQHSFGFSVMEESDPLKSHQDALR